jgi:2-polyprenyl-3-methyl-5-hydroxy-6-metoxy-1,4-benzoquinol methylase
MKLEKYSNQHIHYYTGEIPEMIESVFKSTPVNNFADLGAGDGSLLYSLFRRGYLNQVSNVIAVDISQERINVVSKINAKIKCFVGDVSSLTMIEDRSLDFAVSSQVIEHIFAHDNVVREAYRILRPAGLFYLSTVFKKWYARYFYRAQGKWVLDPTHVREYDNPEELQNIVSQSGFEIVKERKTLQWFPLTDFFLKRMYPKKYARMAYNTNRLLSIFRRIKVPILGYYNWEMIVRKVL